jgi:phytoene dehydrogenase-like protein
MGRTPDALVIGSGPNGLVAAIELARAGWSVVVLESNDQPGGAVRSRELTIPGFVHDMGAAFFPFGQASPALRALALDEVGLRWCHAELDSAHPALDGSCASIARDEDETARCFGRDGDSWRRIAQWHRRTREGMLDMLLGPLPPVRSALRFGPLNLMRLAEVGLSSARGFSERHFGTGPARRVLPALGLHTDIGPSDPCGAAVGFVLGVLASSGGFAVPEGGTSAITDALLQRFADAGGELRTGVRVRHVETRSGEAVALRTDEGDTIEAARAVVADVAAPTLYLDMLDANDVPEAVRHAMRRFPRGFGTFKMDWALDGPVPWRSEQAQRAAVVHTGEHLDDLDRFTFEVRRGELPEAPYLVVGQQSLADPTRAPQGRHTLWAYSRVPSELAGGWSAARERFADRVERRIEGLAPGFRQRILARHIVSPPELEASNANLLGGDLGGGSAQIQHQLFFRPVFPYFRYRTPVKRLYLGSSYTHPGAGVHGACGRNAAWAALQDLG